VNRFRRKAFSSSWFWTIAAPALILAGLFIAYTVSRTVQRPAHLSIATDPNDLRSSTASTTPAPQVPVGLIVGGAAALLGLGVFVVAMNMRSSKKAPTPLPRRAPAVLTAVPVALPAEDTVECPNCAEHVKKKAAVCRFCGFQFDLYVDRKKPIDPGITEPGS
jgi:hypothetical protein